MYTHNGSLITPNTPFTLNGKQYPANWLTLATPADLAAAWILVEPDPPRTLVEAKASKRTEIERARDAASVANVTAHGTQWQADDRSQKLLGNAITLASAGLPLPPYWRDAYNVNMPITALADLLAIAGAMATQTQNAYSKSWAKKAEIDAATTTAQSDAVVW